MKKGLTIFISGMLTITALLILLLIYTRRSVDQIMSPMDENTYENYYIMISDDTSDQWRSIYDAAKSVAEESGARLEWMGEDLPVYFAASDYMKIATAEKADGIILHLRPGEKMTELIDLAFEQEIPVITVLEDDPDSSRVSFIGVNSYQVGDIYGKQILKCLKPGKNKVAVLLDTSVRSSASSLMYSQMIQVVEQGKEEEQIVDFLSYEIDTTTSFDAEEDIRDIFLQEEELPDVLICLDLISTECVCQALVDYNEVGNVKVLGYYASEKVQEGIRKGLVEGTLMLDTEKIGSYCVEALNEYRQLGHVSNYYNAGAQFITIKTLLRQEYQGS